MESSSLKQLSVLMATVFVDMIGFLMVLPTIPFYAKDLGARPVVITMRAPIMSTKTVAMRTDSCLSVLDSMALFQAPSPCPQSRKAAALAVMRRTP